MFNRRSLLSLPSEPSNNLNPAIEILCLILILIFIVSGSFRLLFSLFSRRCQSHPSSLETHIIVPEEHIDRVINRHVPQERQSLIDSLPLFSFDAVKGIQRSSPECPVCLSKFVPCDQLRLLPNCCHAFHSSCIDTWLANNSTCPLCRASVHVMETPNGSIKSSSIAGDSFRLEIGSISRRGSDLGGSRRSYSLGSFDYIVDDIEAEVFVGSTDHNDGIKEKENTVPQPAREVVENVGAGRSWLREYIDRIASSRSSSFSSRALSFRCTTRSGDVTGAAGSADGASWDTEGNRMGEEISTFFRWLTGA